MSTLSTDRGRIERHIIPLLGHRTVKDLTSGDVRKFLQDVVAGKTKADVKTKKQGRAIVKGGSGTGTRTLGLLAVSSATLWTRNIAPTIRRTASLVRPTAP